MSTPAWAAKCMFCEKEQLHLSAPPQVSITEDGVIILVSFYCTHCNKLSALELAEATMFHEATARMVQSFEPSVSWVHWYERMASDALANVMEPEGK